MPQDGRPEQARKTLRRLLPCLHELCGWQYDFHYTLERILRSAIRSWLERSVEQRWLDERREADPTWFQSREMLASIPWGTDVS